MKRTDEEFLEILKDILNKHKCQYFRILKRKENADLLKWINDKTPLLSDKYYKLSTKIYWILNGITEFPRCKNINCNREMRQNVGQGSRGYRNYCCQRCAGLCSFDKAQITKEIKYGNKHYVNREKAIQTTINKYGSLSNMQSEKGKSEYLAGIQKKYGTDITNIFQTVHVKEKIKQIKKEKYGDENYNNRNKAKETNLERYGVKWIVQDIEKMETSRLRKIGVKYPAQDKDICKRIMSKWHFRYFYNNIFFDSKEEVAIFIWLNYKNEKFEYHNGEFFEFIFNEKIYRYFPDFKVNGEFWEIKGDQFFKNKKYKMSTPYAKKESDNLLFEAKYDCMIKNKVKILKTSDKFVIDCINYVKKIFGKNFFKSIKVKKFKKSECK